MITAIATGDDGKRILILGVTLENVRRLMAGDPIVVDGITHPGFPPNLAITVLFGETEGTLLKWLEAIMHPDQTKVVTMGLPWEHPTTTPPRKVS